MHLKHPHVDRMALLRGTRAFALELEEAKMVIEKVEKSDEFVIQAANGINTFQGVKNGMTVHTQASFYNWCPLCCT